MATVLITGCSSGFGLHAAVEFAARGYRVFATMRNTDRAGHLLAAVADAEVEVEVLALDVTDPDSIDAAVEVVLDRAGSLDVVVNNAGTELRGPIHMISDTEARAQFETNVFGLLNVVRSVVPYLEGSQDGVIVNVGSIAGLIARPFAGIYAASKHAVEAITEALHFELGLVGIRVHVVEPGQFATDLAANTATAAAFAEDIEPFWSVSEAVHDHIRALAPDGRQSDPADVARAIVDSASDPTTPLRILVGADAELIHSARHGKTFEEYELTMRSFLDYWEGYRGARPE